MARDPAGRLNVYYNAALSGGVEILFINTNTFTPGKAPSFVTVPWPVSGFEVTPSVLYWMSPVSNNQSQAYELLFYSNPVIAEANFFGTAEILPNYTSYQPIPQKGGVQNIVQGIFDGPIPFPNVNSLNYTFQDSLYQAGTVSYGNSQSTSNQHEQSFAMTVGFQSSGSVTKGVGPAWNISESGGFNLSSGQESGTTLANPIEKRSQLVMANKTIDPSGSMSLNQAVMTVSFFQFTDASGNLITGPLCSDSQRQSPMGFNVATTFAGGTSGSFLPYAVTPGDLASYTPEGINQTMNALGYKGNYFGEVILPNAFKFSDTANYLQCIWSNTGFDSDPSFSSFQTSFTESGWTFDASIYVGVSGGVDLPAYAWNVTALAGVTVSMQGSSTDTSGAEWGVALEQGWLGPPPCPASVGSGIAGYTFLIFFLPPPDGTTFPPNYWVQEMIEYGPKVGGQTFDMTTIDPNSQSWRILYVVTNYVTNDGQTQYVYDGALGPV